MLLPKLSVERELQSENIPQQLIGRKFQEEKRMEERRRENKRRKRGERREYGKKEGKAIVTNNEGRMSERKGRKEVGVRKMQEEEVILGGSWESGKTRREIVRGDMRRMEAVKGISLDLTGKKMKFFKIM